MACDRAHAGASLGAIWSASTQSLKAHESLSHIAVCQASATSQLSPLARRRQPPAKRLLSRSHPRRALSATSDPVRLEFCRQYAHILFRSVAMMFSMRRQRDTRRTSVKPPSAPTERLAPLLR